MSYFAYLGNRLVYILRHILTSKFFFLVTCISFTATLLWMQNVNVDEFPVYSEDLAQEALQNVAQDPRYAEVYRKKNKLSKDLKYILLWTPSDYAPLSYLGNGMRAFIQQNCSVTNCYVTSDRDFFDGNLTRFDAIAFNGRNILHYKKSDLPKERSPHQMYIYFNMESADNYPVCSDIFDDFFNRTATYRLDSDIPLIYFTIKDNDEQVVGPKRNMQWMDNMQEVDDDLVYRFQNKSKAAAWFVSHCSTRSDRRTLVLKLQKELERYGLNIDVYGQCGPLKCSRSSNFTCESKLEREYFFYMSLENSFSEDYVTEKLLTALLYGAIPIVYGGANYSRFLPPSSYIDATNKTVEEIAVLMRHLMHSPKEYLEYFKWRNYYTYHDSTRENVCSVCAALNDRTMLETQTYERFRKWWHPNYTQRCS